MRTYSIVRFRFKGANEVIKKGLTLDEAQTHCNREDTRGDGWFDGYREESTGNSYRVPAMMEKLFILQKV